ncbi:aminodeoxychorismate synthase component I [Halomonas binhaiensis]|uniref:aminodeoxychorismate synthase n=1 Tax=Halomonas binhaiensis TaxID=2562282 RepID=A0A5C1NBF7_9GAMM|nr:aminodeoxychorismate synthase component I [Halomonas binhaiensis]QEM81042.1 aminodeoxychorismate synthase component I [Halomonas binhaiensis]
MTPVLDIYPVTYHDNPLEYFQALRQRPDAVLLDSGRPEAPGGRFDIMSSDPLDILEVAADGIATTRNGQVTSQHPFEAQQQLLEQLPALSADSPCRDCELPFVGGLIGYWGYELGRHLEPVGNKARAVTSLPLARIGLYDWALIQDHDQCKSWLVASAERRRQVEQWLGTKRPTGKFALTSEFSANLTQAEYQQRFEAVKRYIHAGDCYQINLAQRFSAHYEGDLWQAYQYLRQATPTPFAGFMAWERQSDRCQQAILSLSPERFIEACDGQVEARPIKGTRPRGSTPDEDRAMAETLTTSIKDRAENVMIVDLLRNDLGRVCRPGSVSVPQLCGLESYANVHHLVSVIRGQLIAGLSPLQLLEAAFPGGSITGAPKVRAMQIIDELEPDQRSAYCGSLGYIDVRGHMDTSIAIRTLVADAGQLHLWGGGGLVADSDANEEYAETLTKIRHLMDALISGPEQHCKQ